MYLQALKLQGFKSFADPTTLRFEPGVTAVVGPNGCGKSNIADAIRWVLGEQSAKALRGGKMQDVIFEGADTRKPAQLCEVSLLLTDCEKQLGSEFHEIEIMRRVHRDGQSEYQFNGQPCRLKDIQKLFMDTGIGRTSYSIMAQGQIDQILSSKPEERRAVFEEAAGITRYKSQRKEALGKLALTDQNLTRVADVIAEVGRQIGTLRRQAAKALRFKRLSFRLRHLALAQAGSQHAQLSAATGELEIRLAALRAEADERRARLEERQAALEHQRAERSRLHQRAQDAQQAVFDLRSEREQAENAANLSRIKRAGLLERLDSSSTNLGELEMQQRELSEQVDTGAHDKQEQLLLLGTSDDVFQQRNRDLALIEGEATKVDQALQQAKFALLQFESTVARLRTETTGFEVDQKTSAQRHDAMAADIEQVRQQQAAAEQVLAELAARVEEVMGEKARAHQESQTAQQLIADLTREFREAQRKLQDADRALTQRSARLKLLQQLQEKWEGFGEGAKAVLQGRLDSALAGQRATPVAKDLQILPEFGKAIEALLGSAVEAIAVADLDTAKRILAQLETDRIGSVCLQVGALFGSTPHVPAPPAFLKPATEALANADSSHPAVGLLGACYLADDLHAFLDFWQQNPTFGFLAVATRKGEIVDRRGLIYGGFAKKPANSIVQREIDLRETARLLAEEQHAHDTQKAAIEELNGRLAGAETDLEARRAEVLAATQQSAIVQAEHRNAQKNCGDLAQRLARMEHELQSLDSARLEAQVRFDKARTGLVEAETHAVAHRTLIQQQETRLQELRTERDVKRESLAQARLELAERRQRVEVLDRGIADMQRRRAQLAELLIQRRQEIEVWTEQTAELEQDSDRQRARAAQIAETLVVAQQQVEQVRGELLQIERSIIEVESHQSTLRTDAHSSQSELNRCEIKFAEGRQRLQFIEDDVQREFQIRVGSFDWRLLLWRADDEPEGIKPLDLDEEDDEPTVTNQIAATVDGEPAVSATTETDALPSEDAPKRRRKKKEARGEPTDEDLIALERTSWDALKSEIEGLRARLAGMGAVNLVAIEEYAELKQRYDFLRAQCDDLTQAKTELLKTIDEINQTSLQQFQITFDQIKKNFIYTFQTLFGGGVANLELIVAEDILESGIEITAQPPGTKLKSITLLSGGQKTLTAVALLFALYMVKPSPFCLLDELDAPLDESNIGRFTDLLKKFVGESQFIIITHNKRTVSAAQAIYGVTMEERGVSKTVSMRFNHLRGEPELHSGNIAEAVRNAAGVA